MSWPEAVSLMCVTLVSGAAICVSIIAKHSNTNTRMKDSSGISED
jgi:hypothetical protein